MKHRLRHLLALAVLLLSTKLNAAPEPIALWPGDAPGEKGDIGAETDQPQKPDGVIRIGNVTRPTITIQAPPIGKSNGAAVIVCPGGGYSILAWNKEGTEIADWLNSIGVTGIVLKYRVPKRSGLEKHVPTLQDAQRAIGLVRHRAKELGLDPQRIGIMGFSAGGHLSAVASTNYEKRTYSAVDDSDKESCRPDFALLIYPAYLGVKGDTYTVAPELTVTPKTPPTFIVQTQDDHIPVEGTIAYYLALKNAKVSAELHLYPTGGHGYGMRPSEHNVSSWPARAADWMKTLGLMGNSR